MGKLHVHSKLEAVAFALRHRLVEPPRAEYRRGRRSPARVSRPPRVSRRCGDPPLGEAPLAAVPGRRSGIVGRVASPDDLATVVSAAIGDSRHRPAARATSLLGEQGVDRRSGGDLATAGAAG